MNAGGRYPGWRPGIELRDDWLSLTREEIIDPHREIVDPHHHLWVHGTKDNPAVYETDQLLRDTGAGHNVVQTVYVECRSYWDVTAPEHLQSVAETANVARMAAEMPQGGAQIAGIVAHVDLTLPTEKLDEALDAHEKAGQGLLKGIRHSGAHDEDRVSLMIPGRGAKGQYSDPAFRRGLSHLGKRGLTYDTWHYHHQNRDFLDMVRAVPETTIILDHFGTPLGVGRFTGKHDEIFDLWQEDMADLADCSNLRAKLGGLAMPDNGFGFMDRTKPPGSDELLDLQGRWYRHMIAHFGPERCMFESNFPVDRVSVSYAVLWNFFKKLAAELDAESQDLLFAGTARATYGLPPA